MLIKPDEAPNHTQSSHDESDKEEEQTEAQVRANASFARQVEEANSTATTCGVTQRNIDSKTMVSAQNSKASAEDLNIEDIFDLEYLETLLKTSVKYEMRKRIRVQIRLVKKIIRGEKREVMKFPVREINTPNKTGVGSASTDNQENFMDTYVEKRDKKQTKRPPIWRRSKSPVVKLQKQVEKRKVFQTELNQAQPVQNKVIEEESECRTQETLRKLSKTPIKKSCVTTTVKRTKTSRCEQRPSKEAIDVRTSNYATPLNKYGAPPFGLKRPHDKSGNTNVQGTVIQSQYYSKKGQKPKGEISVTKYSSDSKDLKSGGVKPEKGISSETATHRFGDKDTLPPKTTTNKSKVLGDQKKSSEIIRYHCTSATKEATGNQSPKSSNSKETSPSFHHKTAGSQ